MIYTILSGHSVGNLIFEVQNFQKNNPSVQFLGGPYSDGQFHYQAVLVSINDQQILND